MKQTHGATVLSRGNSDTLQQSLYTSSTYHTHIKAHTNTSRPSAQITSHSPLVCCPLGIWHDVHRRQSQTKTRSGRCPLDIVVRLYTMHIINESVCWGFGCVVVCVFLIRNEFFDQTIWCAVHSAQFSIDCVFEQWPTFQFENLYPKFNISFLERWAF